MKWETMQRNQIQRPPNLIIKKKKKIKIQVFLKNRPKLIRTSWNSLLMISLQMKAISPGRKTQKLQGSKKGNPINSRNISPQTNNFQTSLTHNNGNGTLANPNPSLPDTFINKTQVIHRLQSPMLYKPFCKLSLQPIIETKNSKRVFLHLSSVHVLQFET